MYQCTNVPMYHGSPHDCMGTGLSVLYVHVSVHARAREYTKKRARACACACIANVLPKAGGLCTMSFTEIELFCKRDILLTRFNVSSEPS